MNQISYLINHLVKQREKVQTNKKDAAKEIEVVWLRGYLIGSFSLAMPHLATLSQRELQKDKFHKEEAADLRGNASGARPTAYN